MGPSVKKGVASDYGGILGTVKVGSTVGETGKKADVVVVGAAYTGGESQRENGGESTAR